MCLRHFLAPVEPPLHKWGSVPFAGTLLPANGCLFRSPARLAPVLAPLVTDPAHNVSQTRPIRGLKPLAIGINSETAYIAPV